MEDSYSKSVKGAWRQKASSFACEPEGGRIFVVLRASRRRPVLGKARLVEGLWLSVVFYEKPAAGGRHRGATNSRDESGLSGESVIHVDFSVRP